MRTFYLTTDSNVTAKSRSSVTRIPLERPASVRRHLPSVDDRWMLSDFIAGDENAHLAYLFDSATIGDLTNHSPIVLYGEKSTGKTALAITLAVRWAHATKARPLCFTTGTVFAQEYAAAVEIDDLSSFRTRHRDCRLLVIDDLEPLAEKSAAQVELCNTLDFLLSEQAPVIVSLSKLPSAVQSLKPALASRLSAGYSAQLFRPGMHSTEALVQDFVAEIDKSLPAKKIAEFCQGLKNPLRIHDIRQIVMLAHQNKNAAGSLDFYVLSQLTNQFLAGDQLSVISIAKVVARRMRVRLSDLRGSTREASIVRARGLAILLSRRLTSSSLQQIGTIFGGRDHSTVLHAFRKTDRLVESDPELSKMFSDVQSELLNR